MIISTAVFCVAINVYHESRGEDILGQYAVALVTKNRAEQRNKQVCEVVTARKQFSWTINGLEKVKGGYRLKTAFVPKDMKAWNKAVRVSSMVLSNKVDDITEGANHYHAPKKVMPYWMDKSKVTIEIGNHIFYRFV